LIDVIGIGLVSSSAKSFQLFSPPFDLLYFRDVAHRTKAMGDMYWPEPMEAESFAALQKIPPNSVDVGVPGASAAICSSKGTLWHGTAGSSDILKYTPIDASKHISE
jgi:hypothetical protein